MSLQSDSRGRRAGGLRSLCRGWLRLGPGLMVVVGLTQADVTVIAPDEDTVVIRNKRLSLSFDLRDGRYRGIDRADGSARVTGATWSIHGWSSSDPRNRHSWEQRPCQDELGQGRSLTIRSEAADGMGYFLEARVYDGQPYVVLGAGLRNAGATALRLREIRPLVAGRSFTDAEPGAPFCIVDGYGGGEPLEWGVKAYTPLHRSHAVDSRNNLMATLGAGDTRQTLTLGGLTYRDYEKFATIRQPRRLELQRGRDGVESLRCYLDLAREREDGSPEGPTLRLIRGELAAHPHFGRFWCPELSHYAVAEGEVVVEASGLDPGRAYTLGFSWWDMEKRSKAEARVQSILIDQGPGTEESILLHRRRLPRWSNPAKEVAEQAEIRLPQGAGASGKLRIRVSREDGGGPAIVSEMWLRDGDGECLLTPRPEPLDGAERPRREFQLGMAALDPVGRRVAAGETYFPEDRFYLDFITRHPFDALELYGRSVRQAQGVDLSWYDFPTVCLWYAHHPDYGGGGARNTSVGAVREAEAIQASGFLNYARAAVRLVPDTYARDTAQGWWSDERFRCHGSTNLGDFPGGHYQEPYETTEKWGRAVGELGCIPLMYSQTGFRSEDYAQAFPEHMLFNQTLAWQDPDSQIDPDDDEAWAYPWGKAESLWSYDYTDPGFCEHLREVYGRYARAGIRGLMFDYPASGWASGGGMEDSSSTTAAAYRRIFEIPHRLLGPESYVHERSMERGSDVALGVTASQRTENDMDWISPSVVTRCGLRWYKNRVVIQYDTDSKNLVKAANRSRDALRSLLTMAYTVTGRLLLANSFTQLRPDILHDLTRIYPFHRQPLTARPVDALIRPHPTIYHFRITPQQHQVVLYNPDGQKSRRVEVPLAGDSAAGALGLDATRSWHVFDFWNDRYVGELDGSGRLEQTLRPGEARMLAVRQEMHRPQIIATDRHLMQGLCELRDVAWSEQDGVLTGRIDLPGEDPITLHLAHRGYRLDGATAGDTVRVDWQQPARNEDMTRLTLRAAETVESGFRIRFRPRESEGSGSGSIPDSEK